MLLGLSGWSLGCTPASPPADRAAPVLVRPGIEILLSDSVELVRGRRAGLVSNQSGVDSRGTSDVTRLRDAGIDLVALFSPEHGFRGAAAPGAGVASSTDSATGLPIYSLYGRTSAPTDEMLEGVDVMLVDLQDAGARYYTYLFTTIEVMKAAVRRNIGVIVLDRPNPIGGTIQGNVLDPAFASPVGSLAVPMRHGMTLGELARLAKSDLHLGGSLTVVPATGWRRAAPFDETGLPFIPPSPNLRTFEGTNLSVGRGSDTPFTQVGAPWLDTTRVLADIRRAAPAGVRFSGVSFTPSAPGDGKFADTAVTGIRLTVTDRAHYDPTVTAVYLLAAIRTASGGRFAWLPAHFDRLAGGPALRAALEAGTEPSAIVASWTPALERFKERSKEFQLYPDSR